MAATFDLPIQMRALLAGARRKQPGLIALTRQLVLVESPSDVKSAVDACIALAAAHARNLGGSIKIHRRRDLGNVLEAHFGARIRPRPGRSSPPDLKPILLLGHLDTVWPMGTLKSMPCRVSGGRLWGPGTLDMKAGAAMAFTALEMLTEADLLAREIILLLTGDEEIGSQAGRPIVEAVARQCSAVYVLEPSQGLAYKTARKGVGNWRIEVKGVAAHAGVDFEKGANAIRELARVIETVSGFTDLKRGLTVSVGVAGGGTKSNVIPADAWADVDARIARAADGSRIERKFAALRAAAPRVAASGVVDPRCSLTISGGINRPPMERTRGTVRLFRLAQSLARELGFALDEAATGGGSDGNFTAALGIPTLDGMGAVGEGAHARHESVFIEHLAPRTALLAAMLTQ
jgi:glutamate carboxypeptidase